MPLRFSKIEEEYLKKIESSGITKVRLKISQINWQRMKIFLPVFAFIQILIIVIIDISSIRASLADDISIGLGANEEIWIPLSYLIMHICLLICWIIGAVLARRITKETEQYLSETASDDFNLEKATSSVRKHELKTMLVIGVGLLILGMVAGLDQLRAGDISAFTMTVLLASAFIFIRPPFNFIVLTPPFLALICGVLLFQTQTDLKISHLTNGSIFFVSVLVFSTFIYNSQYRQAADSKLLEQLVEDLKESKQLFHTTIENMIDCVSIYTAVRNKEGKIVDFVVDYVNQAACINSQKTTEELAGHSLLDFSPKVIESGIFEEFCKVIHTGEPYYGESITYSNSDNKCIEDACETSAFKMGDGVVVTERDITKKKKEEISTLELSEERFYKVFRYSPNMMSIIRDADLVYIDVNEAYMKTMQLNKEDIVGKSFGDLLNMNVEDYERIRLELSRSGEISNLEIILPDKRTFLFSIVLIVLNGEKCYICLQNDISELKNTQLEISRLDRLNLVGQMAAGIGHEIRNPMTTVRGYLQLLGDKQEYAPQKGTFDLMISELDRANAIITEFLSLTRTQPTKLIYQNLNEILNNLYPILGAYANNQNKHIDFMPGEIPDIELSTKEIHQLVLNLCHNGLDAMKEHSHLTIKTFIEGDKVVLSVHDEGCGIKIEDITKLGTPFFTTKENGTGLGLAICHRIAASHHASIDFETNPQGTTFFVRFNPTISIL